MLYTWLTPLVYRGKLNIIILSVEADVAEADVATSALVIITMATA